MNLQDLKNKGIKTVILNGFKEHIDYVMSLANIEYSGEIKSDDGYSFL